ncbi:MAG: VWA-like domain-containing protein [Actinomycetota bacterium]
MHPSAPDPSPEAAATSPEAASPSPSVDPEPVTALDPMKLAAARLWAADRHPYLASAVFAAPVLPAPELGRVVIDRWWRIHADPAVVERAAVSDLGGELLHLTSHLLRDHAGRADAQHFGEPAELHHWVDAADAEIADDFERLPRLAETVTPDDLDQRDGRLAEEYYRHGSVRDGATNDCGSGAHGEPPPWEPPPPDDETPGVGSDDQELVRQEVAARVAEAGADAPDGLRRWAEERLRPTVDWRAELAACLRRAVSVTAGAVDYSYRRPSRRAAAVDGVVLPSLARPTPEVAVVCDTSASVTDDELGRALTEVDGLLAATGTRQIRFLSCDDAVRSVDRVAAGREVTLLGGGGTDMAAGLAAAVDQQPPPQVVVVLTDGYTPWPPAAPPRTVTVVGLLGAGAGRDGAPSPPAPPAWARVVPIPTVTGP